MAILMAERVVRRVTATLQAGLPAEIVAVLADLNTAFTVTATLPTPANTDYWNHPKAEVAGARAQIEIYEGGFDIENPYTDAAANRYTGDIPITVRATIYNTDGSNAATMLTRMRLMGAAIVRVLLEAYTLQPATDDAIKVSVPSGYRPSWEFDGEDAAKVVKVRVVIPVRVSVEEINE